MLVDGLLRAETVAFADCAQIIITALPSGGTLFAVNEAGEVGAPLALLQVVSTTSHAVSYRPALNANGPHYDSFAFRARDATNSLLVSAPGTISINVTAVDDAPIASSLTVSTLEVRCCFSFVLSAPATLPAFVFEAFGSQLLRWES